MAEETERESKAADSAKQKEATEDLPKLQQIDVRKSVRQRPGMFIGPVDTEGLTFCVLALVTAFFERWSGQGGLVEVTLHRDGTCTVRDDGPGIRLYGGRAAGKSLPTLETYFTQLWGGDLYSNSCPAPFEYSLPVCVNFLSEWFRVINTVEKVTHAIGFTEGVIDEPLRQVDSPNSPGTAITFKPDPQIFREQAAPAFDAAMIAQRLRDLAMLRPGLTTRLHDERGESARVSAQTFRFPNGVSDVCRLLAKKLKCSHREPISASGTWKPFASIVRGYSAREEREP